MFPLLDSRYLYLAYDAWSQSMAYPSQLFKAAADVLDERINPEFQQQNPFVPAFRRSGGNQYAAVAAHHAKL